MDIKGIFLVKAVLDVHAGLVTELHFLFDVPLLDVLKVIENTILENGWSHSFVDSFEQPHH